MTLPASSTIRAENSTSPAGPVRETEPPEVDEQLPVGGKAVDGRRGAEVARIFEALDDPGLEQERRVVGPLRPLEDGTVPGFRLLEDALGVERHDNGGRGHGQLVIRDIGNRRKRGRRGEIVEHRRGFWLATAGQIGKALEDAVDLVGIARQGRGEVSMPAMAPRRDSAFSATTVSMRAKHVARRLGQVLDGGAAGDEDRRAAVRRGRRAGRRRHRAGTRAAVPVRPRKSRPTTVSARIGVPGSTAIVAITSIGRSGTRATAVTSPTVMPLNWTSEPARQAGNRALEADAVGRALADAAGIVQPVHESGNSGGESPGRRIR